MHRKRIIPIIEPVIPGSLPKPHTLKLPLGLSPKHCSVWCLKKSTETALVKEASKPKQDAMNTCSARTVAQAASSAEGCRGQGLYYQQN